MLASELSSIFTTHSHHRKPIEGRLATALAPCNELAIELSFDRLTAPKDEFLYVDLTDRSDTICLHFSFRLQENYMVVNTRENGVWSSEHVATEFDFTQMQFWRFHLVVEPTGTASIQLGHHKICQLDSKVLAGSDVAYVTSNVSAKAVLRPNRQPDDGMAIGYSSEDGRAVILAYSPNEAAAELDMVSVEAAGRLLSDTENTKTHLPHHSLLKIELSTRLTSDTLLKIGGDEINVEDIVGAPAVELSTGFLSLRTGLPAEGQQVVWRGGQGQRSETAVRLSIGADENESIGGRRLQRFFTPISEFIRQFSAWDHYDDFTLMAPGVESTCFVARISASCFSALEVATEATKEASVEDTNELQMAFLDWWNVLRQPDMISEVRARYPMLWQRLSALSENEVRPFENASKIGIASQPGPTVEDVAYWNALRDFDAVLGKTHAIDLRAEVLACSNSLLPAGRRWFFLTLVADLLKGGCHDILMRELPKDFLEEILADKSNGFGLSAGLALLACGGELSKATKMMAEFSAEVCNTLDIRPISASLVQVVKNDAALDEQRQFVYAFLQVLREMKEYATTSPRHKSAIEAIIGVIAASDFQPDWFVEDLIVFVEEQYSTVPEFWAELERYKVANPDKAFPASLLNLANRAQAANTWLAEITLSPDPLQRPPAKASIVAKAERWSYLNTFLELHDLHTPRTALKLEKIDGNMELRKAAHPFASLKSAHNDQLPQVIRNMHRYPNVPSGSLLRDIGQLLLENDAASVRQILTPLVPALHRLEDPDTEAVLLDAFAWSLQQQADETSVRSYQNLTLQLVERLNLLKDDINQASPSLMSAAKRILKRPANRADTAYVYQKLRSLVPEEFLSSEPNAASEQVFFSDTLIGLVTCRAYLETRAKECRDTWVQELKSAGVAVLFFCGSDTLSEPARHDQENDIVYLPVGDTYEDLPAKMLEMFQWIRKNRSEDFVLKIDDDCFLDTQNFLTSMAYRRSHYFGRSLHSRPDAFNRTWHQTKSKNIGAQRAIDTSLTGSHYADGGGSYTLSRHALNALGKVAKTPVGFQLRMSSFFEDKMIGDFMELSGIKLAEDGYTTMQSRRTHDGGFPVLMWGDRSFYPSASTGISVAHLDRQGQMAKLIEARGSDKIRPARVWPMRGEPTLELEDNMLELLTEADVFAKTSKSELICVAAVRNEMAILPHFLDHYRRLGVDLFLFADNLSDDGSREYLLEQQDVLLFAAANEYRHSHFGVEWQRILLDHFCPGRWVILADADEFVLPPENTPGGLKNHCRDLEEQGFDAAQVMMVDMYPKQSLSEADFSKDAPAHLATCLDRVPVQPWFSNTGPYGNMTCYTSSLRHRLMPLSAPYMFTAQKVALFRFNPLQSFSEGFHFGTGMNLAPEPLAFLHYKYSAEFANKAREEAARGQHYGGASEYRTYLDLVQNGLDSFWEDETSKEVDVTAANALALVLENFVPVAQAEYQ